MSTCQNDWLVSRSHLLHKPLRRVCNRELFSRQTPQTWSFTEAAKERDGGHEGAGVSAM